MLNLSRIQLELERAKEKLRSVEEIIQKVEGKTFSNGPIRYGNLKNELHSDKTRSPAISEDGKNQRKRVVSSVIDSRLQKLPSDEMTFSLKRGLREKREPIKGLKRPGGDSRPQGVFARLSGLPFQQADDEDDEEFAKKPSLQSRVITTATEVPSRQEVIAAQAVDEQSKQRNKRMFGALVGTLQKFRKEETRVREREEKKLKVEKKLEEDARREREKLMQEKRELFMEKKRREVEIKRIEWSLNRVKEYEAWEANVIPLKNFIQTQAKPHIFYLPCAHNTKTEERLAHTQKLVDRMIEKRKTNLRVEIENSEKKARKTAAEEAEEDEAENIPEDHDHDHGHEEDNNADQQMQGDFEVENNENGFIVEEREEGENETKIEKDLDEAEEISKKEEKWDIADETEDKETQQECMEYESERENEETNRNLDDSKEEVQMTENKNDISIVALEEVPGDVEMSDETRVDEDQPKSECNFIKSEKNVEERIGEDEESKMSEVVNESNVSSTDVGTSGHNTESTDAFTDFKVPRNEIKNVEEETVKENSEDEEKMAASTSTGLDEKKVEEISEVPSIIKKESVSESEPKTEDSLKKTSEKKDKGGEGSRRREKSRSRKPRRRSRSRSPRGRSGSSRYPSRSNRRRSGSRRKRSLRKRSRSNSPAKKFRRSRSPVSKRGERSGFASKRRSPPSKSRRRNSSRSSSSASPRKRRSRSQSSTSSKSN